MKSKKIFSTQTGGGENHKGHVSSNVGTRHLGLALAVVMTGVLITAVDTTIVILALPEIERNLHVNIASVIWVVIGYLLIITLLATQVGKLGDMYGRVKMYEMGFIIFVIGSALCAISWNEGSIIVFRILQGLGAALVTANSGAVIADLFPPEKRGRAYGFNAVGWSLGAVLGIVLGGIIVTYFNWRWVFGINIPIGIFAVTLAFKVLHDNSQRVPHRIDFSGMITLGLGLFGILWAATQLTSRSLDPQIWGYFIGGIVMTGIFALIERGQKEPMLDLSLFRIPTMTPSLLASLFQGLGNYAVLFLVIMYLQGARGLSPIHASLLLVPGYIFGGFVAPIIGKIVDKIGPILPATIGLGIQVIALLIYAHLSDTTTLWIVVAASVINGIGGSSFFPANTTAVMKASPRELFGITSGALRTFANVGMVFSFSLAILVASKSISRGLAFAIFVGSTKLNAKTSAAFTNGLHSAFYVSMGLLAIAAILSATRVLHKQHKTPPISVEPESAPVA